MILVKIGLNSRFLVFHFRKFFLRLSADFAMRYLENWLVDFDEIFQACLYVINLESYKYKLANVISIKPLWDNVCQICWQWFYILCFYIQINLLNKFLANSNLFVINTSVEFDSWYKINKRFFGVIDTVYAQERDETRWGREYTVGNKLLHRCLSTLVFHIKSKWNMRASCASRRMQ